ncbi:hypothetical protein [Afipia carboxidovorans]|uniref:hypothetical protein n=1 Tax=Afipia carboxidovorans TaxID=40137 RepID=UPI00308D589B|nr:hypothetical protein CRBSH125_09700 [Afipia carboxidovorans]
MSRWLRLYDDTINDPKVLKLPEALRWHWIALLCVASKNGGALPLLDDIAIQLRVTAAKATEILAKLTKAGLLDKTETGFAPHNWQGRQYKSDVSTDRVKRFRNTKRNVSETPPDTEAETDINPVAKATGADAPPDPSIAERELFERGRQVLGKSAGGQIAKLKAAKGGNVALARSVIEAASTKQNPAEYVAAAIRAGPPSAKPLTEFQRKQQETRDVLTALGSPHSNRESGGRPADRVLSLDPSQRPTDLRSGPRADVCLLPGISDR